MTLRLGVSKKGDPSSDTFLESQSSTQVTGYTEHLDRLDPTLVSPNDIVDTYVRSTSVPNLLQYQVRYQPPYHFRQSRTVDEGRRSRTRRLK